MDKKVRARVRIRGRVQGVCFRMETQRAAEQYGVSGWVKNRRDGTVEAVFEGDEERVGSILAWCKKGPHMAEAHHVDTHWEEYTGEFSDFEITY